MADDEELKSMILSFRVSELHMLLGFAGRNKTGLKSELQTRAIELLQLGSYPVIFKIRNIYNSLQRKDTPDASKETKGSDLESVKKMNQSQRGYPPPNYPAPVNQINMQRSAAMYAASVYHHQYQNQNKPAQPVLPTQFAINPDVKLKKLPFYEVITELLKPTSLVPQGQQRQQDSTFSINLTPQQATTIAMKRDMRPGSKIEYAVQVQLRFCLLETTVEQEDCFPPGITVKVNGKICPLPNPIPTNKPGVDPKRPPRPVNITPLVKITPTVANTIHVQWASDYTRGYVMALYLVNKKTSEELLARLKARGVRGADFTRAMIRDKLAEDADSDIATTSLRVSLLCPLGKMRMTTPCRASTCGHLQCFDASLYLQMNERKPTWMCPVCDRPALYERLVLDGYFHDVLLSKSLSSDANEIQLNSDGSWSSVQVLEQDVPNIFDHEVAVAHVQDETKTETGDESENRDGNGITRKVQEIDLTLSDSDDEPLRPVKRYSGPAHATNQPAPPMRYMDTSRPSSVVSGEHGPSLIILDSDSPPSTPAPANSSSRPPPSYYTSSYLSTPTHFLDVDSEPSYSRF